MVAITTATYNRNCGPLQSVRGSATFTTAATDTATLPSSGNAVLTLASGVLTLALGFAPLRVRIVNNTTRIETEWLAPMAANTTLDTAAAGTRTLNTSSKIVVTGNTGTGGSISQAGGTADGAAGATVVLTLSGFATDGDTITWIVEG